MSYYNDLEAEFGRLRVFGDERDLNLVKKHNHRTHEAVCVIHKKDMWLYPEIALADSNLISMCELCVVDYIEAFKEYRKTHQRIIKDRRIAIREKKIKENEKLIEKKEFNENNDDLEVDDDDDSEKDYGKLLYREKFYNGYILTIYVGDYNSYNVDIYEIDKTMKPLTVRQSIYTIDDHLPVNLDFSKKEDIKFYKEHLIKYIEDEIKKKSNLIKELKKSF